MTLRKELEKHNKRLSDALDVEIDLRHRYSRKLNPIIVLSYITIIIFLVAIIVYLCASDDLYVDVNINKQIDTVFEVHETIEITNNVSEEAIDYLNDILSDNKR